MTKSVTRPMQEAVDDRDYRDGERSLTELSGEVIAKARQLDLMLVTAESCTAGALATLLCDTPHAGEVMLGGFVAYSKSCKENVLGVPRELISDHTAVSAEVASAMALGSLNKCSADIAIAITCVGGPKPDEDGNPVGLTHIAVHDRDGGWSRERLCVEKQTSGQIRGDVLRHALQLLLTHIRNYKRSAP